MPVKDANLDDMVVTAFVEMGERLGWVTHRYDRAWDLCKNKLARHWFEVLFALVREVSLKQFQHALDQIAQNSFAGQNVAYRRYTTSGLHLMFMKTKANPDFEFLRNAKTEAAENIRLSVCCGEEKWSSLCEGAGRAVVESDLFKVTGDDLKPIVQLCFLGAVIYPALPSGLPLNFLNKLIFKRFIRPLHLGANQMERVVSKLFAAYLTELQIAGMLRMKFASRSNLIPPPLECFNASTRSQYGLYAQLRDMLGSLVARVKFLQYRKAVAKAGYRLGVSSQAIQDNPAFADSAFVQRTLDNVLRDPTLNSEILQMRCCESENWEALCHAIAVWMEHLFPDMRKTLALPAPSLLCLLAAFLKHLWAYPNPEHWPLPPDRKLALGETLLDAVWGALSNGQSPASFDDLRQTLGVYDTAVVERKLCERLQSSATALPAVRTARAGRSTQENRQESSMFERKY